MGKIISGKDLAQSIRKNLAEDIIGYKDIYGRAPHLVVVLIGDDPASKSYVSGKEKAANEIGIKATTIIKDANTSEQEVLDIIQELNEDSDVDGILVQLPLPNHMNQAKIISKIAYEKDVDGFHPYNVAALYEKKPCIAPCTPRGIMKILSSEGIEVSGKNVCIIGRSNLVGLPISKLLLDANATITICHSRTKNLKEHTSKADILVVAIGRAKFITADMVKEGAVVIDVGVNKDIETNKLVGDVDFKNVEPKTSSITKVPGGVGPMTICSLMENTVTVYLKRMGK